MIVMGLAEAKQSFSVRVSSSEQTADCRIRIESLDSSVQDRTGPTGLSSQQEQQARPPLTTASFNRCATRISGLSIQDTCLMPPTEHDGAAKVHTPRKTSRRNSKGRVKIGHFCIAQMKVCRNNLTDLVSVIYHPTHSHVCSPQDYLHHPLPQDLSSFINCQLGEEVSPSKIFNKVKNINIDKSRDVQTQKVNILTKKRIRERARRQRMAQRLHEDDAKSVYLMASEMVSKENSVVIYKPYGADVVYGPEDVNNLPYSMEIFMFGFQTPRQLQLMKDHCNKILIVDETHGTNQYSYKLLTCMVVDDNRRGWPVAHLVTNKSDAATLQFFFKGLSERIEDPSRINCVITDDDSAIINGIEAGFSSPMRHLLCRWHVIKNLKDNVRTKVPKDLFEDVFSEIRVLMNIEDLNMFEDLCEGFLKKYEEKDKTAKFITYFRQHYLNRTEKWAMCHRNFPHAQVNTTGHVESFHNKFKKMYLKRRVNKRLDDLITMLRNLEWEDHCNRQREALVGFSPIPQHIGERHQKSLAIPDEALVEILANTWEIKSQTKESEVALKYSVMASAHIYILVLALTSIHCANIYTNCIPIFVEEKPSPQLFVALKRVFNQLKIRLI
ncbi:uncharacterized protein LOC128995746 [Macrosteles quadrilineatus]|uniref:uncharacterized protein LOC128995746 n=1 Tax=Macrosteles quadrilineatus TaxID=74068 RepID=UPI0023E15F47|nr:uncharacterized protein LOC128995746 [Macrosteles quadrilineatus]